MRDHTSYQWRALVLGAVNGVLVGAAAYVALWLFVEYQNQRLFQEEPGGGDVMHVTLSIKWYGLPIVGAVAFALSAYVIHRYLAHHLKSIVLLWQTIGAASMVLGMLTALAVTLVDRVFGAVPFDYANTVSWKLLWTLLAAFGLVALINFLYGSFIQISAKQYEFLSKVGDGKLQAATW